MGILIWIVFGLMVGVATTWIMPGRDPGGIIVTISLGIVGAVVGGMIGTAIGFWGRGRLRHPQHVGGYWWRIAVAIRLSTRLEQSGSMISLSIHNLRQQKGVSLLCLAERSGMDLKRDQAIFHGRWTPSANQRSRIAVALDAPVDGIAWQHSTPVEHFYGPC